VFRILKLHRFVYALRASSSGAPHSTEEWSSMQPFGGDDWRGVTKI